MTSNRTKRNCINTNKDMVKGKNFLRGNTDLGISVHSNFHAEFITNYYRNEIILSAVPPAKKSSLEWRGSLWICNFLILWRWNAGTLGRWVHSSIWKYNCDTFKLIGTHCHICLGKKVLRKFHQNYWGYSLASYLREKIFYEEI